MNKFLFSINFRWLFVCMLVMFISMPSDGYSQTQTDTKGEVININYHLKVAFVDISQIYLNKGDVVEVQIDYQTMVYMQVLEVSAVISKIGVGSIVKRNFNTNASDFTQIRIGSTVRKIEFYNPYVRESQKKFQKKQSTSKMKAQDRELGGEEEKVIKRSHNGSLRSEQDVPKNEHDEDFMARQDCQMSLVQCRKKRERLEEKISILREKLEYMQKLFNKNSQN